MRLIKKARRKKAAEKELEIELGLRGMACRIGYDVMRWFALLLWGRGSWLVL